MYWTEHCANDGTVSLHQLNLRESSSTTSTVLSSSTERRRRKRENLRRTRRTTRGLADISLSPALAQDPLTAELLLCDRPSGDIMRCNIAEESCVVEVDHSDLLATSSLQNVGE